jgi:hypothetical protein
VIRDAGQVYIWFDTTLDADYWWEVLVTRGIDAKRSSDRVVMWFMEDQ